MKSLLLTGRRRVVQFVSLVLLNSKFIAVSSERFCLPVMNCEACALAWLGCPIGQMSNAIAFWEFPFLTLALVAGVGVIMGRFLCAWVCPMGLLQDLLHKIPSAKFRVPGPLKALKYVFLLVSVVAVAYFFGKGSPFFFCNFCPTAALEVVIPTMIIDQDFSMYLGRIVRFGVLLVVLVLAVLSHRSFCKIMCPVGALVALTNKVSLLRLRLNKTTCVHCTKCNKACPMDVPVMASQDKGRPINRHTECIECLTCQEVCPVQAIDNNSHVLPS